MHTFLQQAVVRISACSHGAVFMCGKLTLTLTLTLPRDVVGRWIMLEDLMYRDDQ